MCILGAYYQKDVFEIWQRGGGGGGNLQLSKMLHFKGDKSKNITSVHWSTYVVERWCLKYLNLICLKLFEYHFIEFKVDGFVIYFLHVFIFSGFGNQKTDAH